MALFAHRLKISMMQDRMAAALSRRAEIRRRAHQNAALYSNELERVKQALADAPQYSSMSEEGIEPEFSDVAAEFRQALLRAEHSVQQLFPKSLTSVKVSSAHGRLAAEAASRCRAVLAAGETRLVNLQSVAVAAIDHAEATDGALRAQIKLLGELQTLEASARQVLAELRKGSSEPDEVEKLKADEVEFAAALKQHLDEQKQVAAWLVAKQ